MLAISAACLLGILVLSSTFSTFVPSAFAESSHLRTNIGSQTVEQSASHPFSSVFQIGHANSNGTFFSDSAFPADTPIASPYVPAPSLNWTHATSATDGVNAADPQEPCTVSGYGQPETNCGDYFLSVYGHNGPQSKSGWEQEPGSISISVSFVGSNPSSLGSGNWIAGGISTISGTSVHSWDIGIEFYTYMDSSGTIGIAWYVLGACEYTPTCALYGYPTYKVYNYNSAVVYINGMQPNYATDTIDMMFYYCTSQSCLNYNNGNPLYIFDVRDSNLSPSYYTLADIPVPSEAFGHNFSYGVYTSCPYDGNPAINCNPPYDNSYGYQMGITSNINSISPSLLVTFSKPTYNVGGIDHIVAHGGTIGAQLQVVCHSSTCAYQTDAWWHDFWSWGGYVGSPFYITPVGAAPIKDLVASQVNGQTFTTPPNYYSGIDAYWPLDEGSGSQANDVINSYTGNLVNSPTWLGGSNCITGGPTATFTANYCIQLSSSNSQEISLPATSNGFGTNGATQLTAIAWFDASSVSANQKVFCIWAGDSDAAFCLAIQNGLTYTELFLNGNSYNQNSLGSVSANSWHQIAITWSNSNSYYDVYLDGSYIGNVAAPSGATISSSSATGALGALGSCNCFNFNGKIDDAMVYSSALSSSQIQQLYQAVLGQNYASTGTECVKVTNFNQLVQDSGS